MLEPHRQLACGDQSLSLTNLLECQRARCARVRTVCRLDRASDRSPERDHCLAVERAQSCPKPRRAGRITGRRRARRVEGQYRRPTVPAGPYAANDVDPVYPVHGRIHHRAIDMIGHELLDVGVDPNDHRRRKRRGQRLVKGGCQRGLIGNTRERERTFITLSHWSHDVACRCAPEGHYFSAMLSPTSNIPAELAAAVDDYQLHGNHAHLRARLREIAAATTPDALIAAAEPYRQIPEVAGPLYEYIVDAQPGNARAIVILANAYWLTGRGPEVVGALASRAITADATNRGAWHLWALSESDPRQRVTRWQQVIARFPSDDLARAALADNAASLAGAEHDVDALDLAIETYEHLLSTATDPTQRAALDTALTSLRGWKL